MNAIPGWVEWSTLVEGLVESAQRRPYAVTFFPETREAIDANDLDETSARYAAGLLKERLPPGTVVGFLASGGRAFLVSLFGVLRAGAAVSVLPTPSPTNQRGIVDQLSGILRSSGIRHLVVSPVFDELARELRSRCPDVALLWPNPTATRMPLPQVHRSQTAMVQFTAGTTGVPKGVALNHGEVMAGIRAMRRAALLNPADILVQWLPLSSHMGLAALVGQIVDGGTSHVFSPGVLRRQPHKLLRYLADRKATVTLGDNASYERLCTAMSSKQSDGIDLSRWRVAFNGGEQVTAGTIGRFKATFARANVAPTTMHPVYQLTEAAAVVTSKHPNASALTVVVDDQKLACDGTVDLVQPSMPSARPYVSVGPPVAGVELRIVDTGGQLSGDGVVGEVQIRGPSVTFGYYRDLRATTRSFAGTWLRTGDRGFSWDGQLFLVERRHGARTLNGAGNANEHILSSDGEPDSDTDSY
ncbi:AMP-binding protein [Qaidamihabitans albus]|uniref:AMP-binding protein n=1 Tax=Qaidamihabitans albus TaxID=2795733 RepID=UPI0018F10ABC|nr:AMP-binding protein [Qaidamihabitans albus]